MATPNSVWRTVARKELRDALRDRRAIAAVLLFPLFGPAMIYFMMNQIVDIAGSVNEVELPVVGYQYATDLMDFLEQNGIDVKPVDDSIGFDDGEESGGVETDRLPPPESLDADLLAQIKGQIENRTYDFILLVPPDFDRRVRSSLTVNLELHFHSARTAASAQVGRVEQLIRAWVRETNTLRLLSRGVNPQVTSSINLHRIDVADNQARAQRALSMLPFFIMMAAFVCGMGVAVDATAGERERKSLEPLLVNPVPRASIVVGKWLVAALFAGCGLLLVMVLSIFALQHVPLAQLGLVFSLGKNEVIGIVVTLLPLAFLATSMQMFIGMFAKSFKDAQSYLGLVSLLPMIPMLFNLFNSQAREMWMNFIPILGQYMLLTDVVSGKTPPIVDFVLSAAVIACFSFFFIYATAYMLKRERVIFT